MPSKLHLDFGFYIYIQLIISSRYKFHIITHLCTDSVGRLVLVPYCPLTLSIETTGVFTKLIPRNTVIPTCKFQM